VCLLIDGEIVKAVNIDVIISILCLGALKGSTDHGEITRVVAAIEKISNIEAQDIVFDFCIGTAKPT
jgi:hypothetical protein